MRLVLGVPQEHITHCLCPNALRTLQTQALRIMLVDALKAQPDTGPARRLIVWDNAEDILGGPYGQAALTLWNEVRTVLCKAAVNEGLLWQPLDCTELSAQAPH
jgi:hypothetical protein